MRKAKEKLLLTPKEAKVVLRVGTNRIYEIFKRDDFPSIVIGRKYFVRRDALEQWIIRQEGRSEGSSA